MHTLESFLWDLADLVDALWICGANPFERVNTARVYISIIFDRRCSYLDFTESAIDLSAAEGDRLIFVCYFFDHVFFFSLFGKISVPIPYLTRLQHIL